MDVEPNSEQLLVYAIGAWRKYDPDGTRFRTVRTVIIQPKKTGKIKMAEFKASGIRLLERKYKAQAAPMLKKAPKPKVGPWCEHYAKCRPYCKAHKKDKLQKTADFFKEFGL